MPNGHKNVSNLSDRDIMVLMYGDQSHMKEDLADIKDQQVAQWKRIDQKADKVEVEKIETEVERHGDQISFWRGALWVVAAACPLAAMLLGRLIQSKGG